MGLFKELLGLLFIFIAWFNFFNLVLPFRIMLFILGFDMTGIALKIGVFIISYFGFFPYIGFSNLAITLLILVAIEVLLTFFVAGFFLKLILKPLAILFLSIFAGLDIQLALILSGIDLLLNMSSKK